MVMDTTSEDELIKLTLVTVMPVPEKSTVGSSTKSAPLMVTLRESPWSALSGVTVVMTGGGSGGGGCVRIGIADGAGTLSVRISGQIDGLDRGHHVGEQGGSLQVLLKKVPARRAVLPRHVRCGVLLRFFPL